MDLLIWRWSTAVQLTSLVMIALFFVALTRSVRLVDLRWWVWAWVCNLAALAVAVSFWLFQPESALFLNLLRGIYMSAKTASVLLLIEGAWALKRADGPLLRPSLALAGLAIYGAFGALLVSGIAMLGIVQQGALGVLFGAGTLVVLWRPLEKSMLWLAGGFALRSALSFVESAAYAVELMPAGALAPGTVDRAAFFTTVHSSFDSGTEWLIALGCVLALSERTQSELRQYNAALLEAQEGLRQIADRDALTGLANRRGLPAVLRAVQPEGASVAFFDLDDFKAINDRHGHQMGDKCLKRFADALRECFRPEDTIVRYAGDEFLVVASGLDWRAIHERGNRLRQRLGEERGSGPAIRFSLGVAELAAGGDPEAALSEADLSMYRAKAQRRESAGGPSSTHTTPRPSLG
jgi:diguanylate cyclase (GGDEF)-like protein